MYIFGGHRLNNFLNDLWKLSLAETFDAYKWTYINSDGPSRRLGHSMITYGNGLYLYGGFYNDDVTSLSDYLNDLWHFDFIKLTWRQLVFDANTNTPSKRMGHSFSIMNDQIILFGGYYNNLYFNDIWRFNTSFESWIFQPIYYAEAVTPPPRSFFAMEFYNSSLYIIGGHGSSSHDAITIRESIYSDIWKFDFSICPNECNNRGYCEYGFCFCNNDYSGIDCQLELCYGSKCSYNNVTRQQDCVHCSGNVYFSYCHNIIF